MSTQSHSLPGPIQSPCQPEPEGLLGQQAASWGGKGCGLLPLPPRDPQTAVTLLNQEARVHSWAAASPSRGEARAAGTEGVSQGQRGTSSSSPGGEGQEKDGKPGPQGALSQTPQRLGNWGCPARLLGLRELQASSHLRRNKASVFSPTKEL